MNNMKNVVVKTKFIKAISKRNPKKRIVYIVVFCCLILYTLFLFVPFYTIYAQSYHNDCLLCVRRLFYGGNQ